MHTVRRECKLRASRMGDDLAALKFEDDDGKCAREGRGWCYSSDAKTPHHGDWVPRVGDDSSKENAFQPDIEEAKRLALVLVAAR